MSEARDRLRQKTLGSSVVESSMKVEWDGDTYEVRSPSLAQQKRIRNASVDAKSGDSDDIKALVLGLIECIYVPDTNEKVFEKADVESLMERSTNGFVGVFMKALGKLSKVDIDETKKNSATDQTEQP
jgi:DNA-binding protein YbaB